jgi:hypothetical protein
LAQGLLAQALAQVLLASIADTISKCQHFCLYRRLIEVDR